MKRKEGQVEEVGEQREEKREALPKGKGREYSVCV